MNQVAFEDSQQFTISIFDLTRIENDPCPGLSMLQEPEKGQMDPLLKKIVQDIMINIE